MYFDAHSQKELSDYSVLTILRWGIHFISASPQQIIPSPVESCSIVSEIPFWFFGYSTM